jgi:phosphohistidine phosphatase SixA
MRLMRLALLCVLSFNAAVCAAAPGYWVMRHLQKTEGTDPGLSAEGIRGAERLATWFKADPPRIVYVSSTRRARETAAPLAARLKLVVKEYDPRDTPALVARVKAETKSVLIVGHSNTVADIVEKLGGIRPAALSESDYGAIWHVASRGKTEMRALNTR